MTAINPQQFVAVMLHGDDTCATLQIFLPADWSLLWLLCPVCCPRYAGDPMHVQRHVHAYCNSATMSLLRQQQQVKSSVEEQCNCQEGYCSCMALFLCDRTLVLLRSQISISPGRHGTPMQLVDGTGFITSALVHASWYC